RNACSHPGTTFGKHCCAAAGDWIQSEGSQVAAAEGDAVTFNCSYNTTDSSGVYLYWYRLSLRSGHNETGGQFSLDFRKSEKYVGLKIAKLEVSDSAIYFCAIAEKPLGYHCRRVNSETFTKSSDQFSLVSETNQMQIKISLMRDIRPQVEG
uniref:Ig-like domain-containing protein n=1 Tax=Pelusios castaneus TaxID=367368 RepID=A0A8C8RG06_9SAUR